MPSFAVSSGAPGGVARLEFSLLQGHHLHWAQTAEHALGLTWRIMTLLSEGRCHLQRVWFPHPAVADLASYQARFDAPISFESGRAALGVAARDLDLPIRENNQELHYLGLQARLRNAEGFVPLRMAVAL